MNNEEYYTENVIIDRDDLYINMDKFESGKCNVILVTGFSGSGKSTLGKEMVAKYKCDDHFELDALEWWFDGMISEDELKEGMPPIYDWLIHNKKLMNLHRPTNAEIARMMNKLIPHVINWCRKNKNKKYVVDGIQLYESWAENDRCNYLEYPIVLKGTSGLKSMYRAMKRNGDKITDVPFYLKWLAKSNKQVDALYKAMKEAYENEEVTEEAHEHHDEVDAMSYAMNFLNKYSDTPFTESVNSNTKYTIMMNVNKDKIKEYSLTNKYLSHFRISPPDTNCTFLVDGMDDKKLIGAINIEKKSDGIWIQALEVSKSYQKHGYGKILVDLAKNQHATKLTVRKTNESAIRLYEKCGFVIEKEFNANQYLMTTRKKDKVITENADSEYQYTPVKESDMDDFIKDMNKAFHIRYDRKQAEHVRKDMKAIKRGDTIVGYVGFSHYKQDGKKYIGLGNFMIKPEYQGKGYGRSVIKDIIAKNDCDEIYCYVDKKNTAAISFYKKIGNVDTDHLTKYGYYVTLYSKDTKPYQEESFMSEYLQSSHPRKKKKVMNDEGKEVPDKCTKCGGDIGVFIQGEPVYLCKNCKKYFGTVKFPSKKKNKPLTESVDQECDYVFTEDSKFDFEKAILGTDYVKNLRKVDILNAKLKNKKITQEQFDKEYAKISTVNADGFVMTIPKNGSEGGKPKVVRPNKDKPGNSFKDIKKGSNDKSSYNGNIKSKSDAEKFDHYNDILRRTEDYREYKDAFKNMARLLGNPNACTIKIMANSGGGKINGECFNNKQSAGCGSSDKLYHTSNQKGITRLNGKFRGHEGFYFSSKRVYFHKNNPGSINTSSNSDYIAKDGEYVYQFMGNPSSAFVDPEIKGSAVFIETDTSIPVKDVTDQFKKKSKPVTESVDPECECLVAFMEAAVKNTTILKDLIYPIVEKTFTTQANVRKYKMLISQFFEKNTPKLTTPGPQYLIVFGDADKDEFYKLFGITKEEIIFAMKNVIKSAGSSAEFKYLTNNPFLSFLYYIIRYFTLHHDDKALNATLGLFSIDVYWSIFTKYFPNGVIEPVMNYTIDNLTDKFIIKKAGTIFGALTESAKHSYEFHKSKIRTGNDPDCIAFLQRIRNDQNSMFRTLSGIYYDNHKKGNAITTRNDDYDPENPILDDITSASTEVQATVNRVCMPMIANGVDISLAEAAAAIGNVSITNLRIYLMKIFVNERLDEITQIVESILFLYINGEHKSSRDIRSAHFLYWTCALFKKTNSKDGNIVRINTILNRWGEETGIYKAFKSEGSKINYKRAIFTYIAMCIQKYN